MRIINKIYNIDSKLNKSIVLISDIHYSNKKDINRLNIILDSIKEIKPNYICIPGDIINKSKVDDEKFILDWFNKLSNICKVIISIGNHEFYISKYKGIYGLNKVFFNKISKIDNIYLLDNKNILIDNINFIGITLPMEYYKEKYNLNSFNKYIDNIKTKEGYYNILLCHSPINISNKEVLKNREIDLVLCGHMHGGVVPRVLRPIFKTRGLISPNKRLFPKNAYGYIKIYNTCIIITSGIKVFPYKLLNKFFNPEIVKILI